MVHDTGAKPGVSGVVAPPRARSEHDEDVDGPLYGPEFAAEAALAMLDARNSAYGPVLAARAWRLVDAMNEEARRREGRCGYDQA